MAIKLVAIDLDDTLLNSEINVSDFSTSILQEVSDLGIRITLATGRMFRSAQPYALKLGIDVPLITYQGALVKNAFSNEVLYHKTIPRPFGIQVAEMASKAGYHYQTYFDDNLYMTDLTPEGRAYAMLAGVDPIIEPELLQRLHSQEPTKILIINDNLSDLQQLESQLNHVFSGLVYITRSKPNYLEIMNRQATKGQALQAVSAYFGVNRQEVMAIGDSYNDIEMLKYAGTAVVVRNAPSAVKAYADYLTESNDEDGVAKALQRLVLAKNGRQ